MLSRRGLVLGLGAGVTSAAQGQLPAGRPARVGVVSWWGEGGENPKANVEERLAELGIVIGRDVTLTYRFAGGDSTRAMEIVRELIALPADIIIAIATPAAVAAKRETSSIPIVFQSADAIRSGLVTSLARPGGNLTGVSTVSTGLSGKRLEFLREMVPGLKIIAFLGSTRDPNGPVFAAETEAAAEKIGLKVRRFMVGGAAEFASAFSAMTDEKLGAVVIQPLFVEHRAVLAELALKHRLPSAADQRPNAEAGLLLAYGTSRRWLNRKLVDYAVKIMRGAKPGDLAVEQPTSFELVVNARTARALGLTIPQTVLAFADEVIE